MIRYSPYLLPLTLQDSRATFLAANLLPASDPPRLLSTFRMKFLNMASKFFPDLTPSTLQPPLSFLSLPCLLPKPFPLPGCQTLCHEGSCLVTAWPMYSLLLLPGLPSLCPLSHINVYYFSGLSLNVTARNPSLTSPIPSTSQLELTTCQVPRWSMWPMTPVLLDSAGMLLTCLSPRLDCDLFESRSCILILVARVPDLLSGS